MVQTQRESVVAKARGFSLIELMIAVAILGILIAIAVPSYQGQLRKGRRAEAQAFVSQVAQRQQQYLLDARTYALGGGALIDLNMVAPTSVTDHYAITVTPAAPTLPPSFTVVATPTSTVQIPDGILSLTNTGLKQRVVGGTDKGW
jgi:type IV pilus assembly protein PilE